MSQAKLAELVSIGHTAISGYERNIHVPTEEVRTRIAAVLNETRNDIRERTSDD
jgi:transcriptional regulator with XRE-family HTH domain